jgi:hypothetical protein
MNEFRKTKKIKLLAGLVLFGALAGYVYFQARFLIEGPVISIVSPQNGSSVEEPLVTISGTTKNISYITLNNRQIFVDENGRFEEKLIVAEGYNIMGLVAKDRFGRKVEKTIELFRPRSGNGLVAIQELSDDIDELSGEVSPELTEKNNLQ